MPNLKPTPTCADVARAVRVAVSAGHRVPVGEIRSMLADFGARTYGASGGGNLKPEHRAAFIKRLRMRNLGIVFTEDWDRSPYERVESKQA